MKKNRVFIFLFLIAGCFSARAQDNEIIRNYINEYRELAIAEMQRTGVPAAIKLAQGIHETMAGTSPLVKKSNNHFGIKCKSSWTGPSVAHDDDARGECFRKYPSAQDSWRDHSNFLKGSPRYASLFSLDPADYRGWANGLKKAGYATNPRYPVILIRLIEEYNLQDYTMIALGKMPSPEIMLAKKEQEPAVAPQEPEIKPAVVKSEETVVAAPAPVYPEGLFTINETKVIYIRKGTSYLSVAQQYEIPLARIFEFNDMRQAESAAQDQLLYLQRKRKTGNEDFHIVKPGETLQQIAQLQAIRLESLLEYNWLKDGMQPAPGERLSLRGKSGAMPRLALKENYSIGPAVKTGNYQ